MEASEPVFNDPTRLEKIDQLIKLGVGEFISLPQLVVVGDQSSGKSSVLEGLTELPFPRDSTLCTRFATKLVFRRAPEDEVRVSIIPSPSRGSVRAHKLKAWGAKQKKPLTAQIFKELLTKACKEMCIPAPGEASVAGQSAFSEDILQIELTGPNRSHFSVLDAPGLFRTPTPGVTTKADIKVVENMMRGFIKDRRTIILAVLPANVDIATQEILELAAEVDPQGMRTLGVLTKPDLVESGTEDDVIQLLEDKKKPLKLGYCVIRNRKQSEQEVTPARRHEIEEEYFKTGPFRFVHPDRVGISALHRRLLTLLRQITNSAFPQIRQEIDKKLTVVTKALEALGPSRTTEHQQRAYLTGLATRYQEAVSCGIAANYNRSEYFRSPSSVRLATLIVNLNDQFSEAMLKRGQAVLFTHGPAEEEELPKKRKLPQSCIKTEELNSAKPSTEEEFGLFGPLWEGETDAEGQLVDDLRTLSRNCIAMQPDPSGILKWLNVEYHKNRGFELGTFNPAIIPSIFRDFTINWESITGLFMCKFIRIVHIFSCDILRHYTADERVHNALCDVLAEDFKQQYAQAHAQAAFLLDVERSGTMMTTNHYFAQSMTEAVYQRYEGLVQRHQKAPKTSAMSYAGAKPVVCDFDVSGFLEASRQSNEEHTVQTIHDVLRAYYKVARKRFVDSICMQAADYHLVSGPHACLKRFDSQYVLQLSSERLEAIAGEDAASVERRARLMKEIESLHAGEAVLSA